MTDTNLASKNRLLTRFIFPIIGLIMAISSNSTYASKVNSEFLSDYVEPKYYSYTDFPADSTSPKGMMVLKGDVNAYNVKWLKNIEYVKRETGTLYLQVLRPNSIADHNHFSEPVKPKEPWPIVVYVPGSAWFKQDILSSIPNLTKLAERGFVVAVVEYRSSEEAKFPAQIIDTKEAIRFIKKHVEDYNADPDKIVVFGDSSGGHTALMTAYASEKELLGNKDTTNIAIENSINGVISYYSPVDISKMNNAPSIINHLDENSPEGYLIGKKKVLENMELVEPTIVTNYIDQSRNIPPTLIVHGDKDRLVAFSQSVLLYNSLSKNNKDVIFYKLHGADHGGAPFWTSQLIDVLENFINDVVNR
jgi:acetyl esterase/lipase